MSTLLHIDSSPMGAYSVSRALSATFVQAWEAAHPGGTIINRDVTTTPIPALDAAWAGAAYTPAEARTAEQNQILALSDEFIAELRAADEYVIGLPMHNFHIPSTLKLWIDQIARVNETFSYATGAPEGLLKGKKVTFIIASGGDYSEGSPAAGFNFIEPYLRSAFGFLGITDSHFYWAGGASAVQAGKVDRDVFLADHSSSLRTQFSLV